MILPRPVAHAHMQHPCMHARFRANQPTSLTMNQSVVRCIEEDCSEHRLVGTHDADTPLSVLDAVMASEPEIVKERTNLCVGVCWAIACVG
jgi:hypothetical protein